MDQRQKEVILEMLNSMSNEAVEELLKVLQEKKSKESESIGLDIGGATCFPLLISFIQRFSMWNFGETPEWKVLLINGKCSPMKEIVFSLRPGIKSGTINVFSDSSKAYDLSSDAAIGFILRHAPW